MVSAGSLRYSPETDSTFSAATTVVRIPEQPSIRRYEPERREPEPERYRRSAVEADD